MTKSSFYFCFDVPEKSVQKWGEVLSLSTITFLITDLNGTKEKDFFFFETPPCGGVLLQPLSKRKNAKTWVITEGLGSAK